MKLIKRDGAARIEIDPKKSRLRKLQQLEYTTYIKKSLLRNVKYQIQQSRQNSALPHCYPPALIVILMFWLTDIVREITTVLLDEHFYVSPSSFEMYCKQGLHYL